PPRVRAPLSRPLGADGPAEAGPPAPGSRRPLRRLAGSPARDPPPRRRVRRRPAGSPLPLAPPDHRPAADGVAPSTPGGPDAQRRARGRLAPWPDAAGDLGLPGRDAAGPAHLAHPAGATGRGAGVAPGGPQRHGPAGSRGADP